jgi:NADH pyrophosphatase NudC (nudix superfamily)
MSTFKMHCPKCGSMAVEKHQNQERQCSQCGEIFYFVTPKSGSQLEFKKYEL